MNDVQLVLVYATLTAVATGLGALPFAFFREISKRFVAYSSAVAGGLMLGASFGLVAEGTAYGRGETLIGALFAIDLYRYKMFVQHLGNSFIVETLPFHHMAPVTS